jgi:hypothetical protein
MISVPAKNIFLEWNLTQIKKISLFGPIIDLDRRLTLSGLLGGIRNYFKLLEKFTNNRHYKSITVPCREKGMWNLYGVFGPNLAKKSDYFAKYRRNESSRVECVFATITPWKALPLINNEPNPKQTIFLAEFNFLVSSPFWWPQNAFIKKLQVTIFEDLSIIRFFKIKLE